MNAPLDSEMEFFFARLHGIIERQGNDDLNEQVTLDFTDARGVLEVARRCWGDVATARRERNNARAEWAYQFAKAERFAQSLAHGPCNVAASGGERCPDIGVQCPTCEARSYLSEIQKAKQP